MRRPTTPASVSVAKAGDIADHPKDIWVVESSDEDDQPVGLAIRWHGAEWLWAEAGSYQTLESAR